MLIIGSGLGISICVRIRSIHYGGHVVIAVVIRVSVFQLGGNIFRDNG